MALADRVLETVRKHGMLPEGGRVLVALSGGPDSVALLHLLRELEANGHVVVAGAGHLNHGLRDAAADDEQFCRALAQRIGVPFRSAKADVREQARIEHRSLEDAGRRVRYEFLRSVATELGADAVATGHTRDDQAETFLLRLVRGAGPRGLAGIWPKAGEIIRPLIDIRRAALQAWLAERGLEFREDESNRNLSIPRNRVRHELIPLLERSYSPGIVDVLAREAAIARADEDHLQKEAIDLAASVVLVNTGEETARAVDVDAAALRSLDPALASRIGRIALAVLAPARFIASEHIERLLTLAHAGEGAAVSLPGQQAVRRGERLVLSRRAAPAFSNSFDVLLSIPGEVLLAPQGWAVSAAWDGTNGGGPASMVSAGDPLSAAVAGDALEMPLRVRSRRAGDRVHPLGMGGRSRKLQDLLVDRKVPRGERDTLPLVVDGQDRIVWVVGQAVAEDFRVTGLSRGVLLLKARRLGGVG